MNDHNERLMAGALMRIDDKLGKLVNVYIDERQAIGQELGEMHRQITELRELVFDGVAVMGRVLATSEQRAQWRRDRDEWIARAMAKVQPGG